MDPDFLEYLYVTNLLENKEDDEIKYIDEDELEEEKDDIKEM